MNQLSSQVPNSDGVAVLKPLYSQVRDMLAMRISTGQWAPGAMLPNESSLATGYGVSIGTIRRAVEGLEELGLVVRRQGRGTYVGGLGLSSASDRLCRLRAPSGALLKLTTQTISRERRAANAAEVSRLRLERPSEVLELRNLVLSRQVRIGLEISVLPAEVASVLPPEPMAETNLYANLGAGGILVTSAEESVQATTATPEIANLLRVTPNAPVLVVRRLALGIDQRPVELRTATYAASQTTYTARIV